MYRLTVVAGPNRGENYDLRDGETSIGRVDGNEIVLQSSKISKKHCVLIVSNGQVVLKDHGSSNGTFVNGVLAKVKPVRPGDRISVGDIVMELNETQTQSNVIAFPTHRQEIQPQMQQHGFEAYQNAGQPQIQTSSPHRDQVPADLSGKAFYYFEKTVMPFFYSLLRAHEWKIVMIGLFFGFLILNMILSVSPLLDANKNTVRIESARRARFMARQIVERNAAALAAQAETRVEIGAIESEDGVRVALLTDLNSRIIAPAAKMNSHLTSGPEAILAADMAKKYKTDYESGIVRSSGDIVVAIEPLKVLDARMGRNVVAAMAVVSIDMSVLTPDLGMIGLIYSKSFIVSALLALFVMAVFYRLIHKPFEVLNSDIDQALKGDQSQVTHPYKWDEMKQLWDVINSTLHRLPKGGRSSEMGSDQASGVQMSDISAAMDMLADLGNAGVIVFDENQIVLHLNSHFEEISGIRSMEAVGRDVSAIARDQAFSALTSELFGNVSSGGGMKASEEFEFSGVPYRVEIASVGSFKASGYVMTFKRKES